MPGSGLVVHVLALRDRADRLVRQTAEEAASILKALNAKPILVEGAADATGADAMLVVAPHGSDVEPLEEGSSLTGRAVACMAVAEEQSDGASLCQRARRALRRRGATVIARQQVLSPKVFGPLGLEGELERERMQAVLELLLSEADRLKAEREGWEEPEQARHF